MFRTSRLGWLAVPAFLAVLILIGLGVSSEGRSDFESRTDASQDQASQLDDSGSGRAPEPQVASSPDQQSSTERFEPSGDEPAEITIATETGEIVIQVDEDGNPVRLTPVGPDGSGESVDIDPDDLVAVRLTEDGRLEVVPIDEIEPDDTIVAPADGGFDLQRPDGSTVEFRADGENGGITATEIAPDGEATELEPNADGSVTLSDGTTVGPIDFVDELGPIERLIERTRQLPWPWLAAALVALVAASVALAIYLHRKRSDEGFDFGELAGAGVTDGRFEQFLDSLSRDPDPSRAVRIGFSVAEQGLGGLPRRRADETPFEWHRRAAEAGTDPSGGAMTDTLGTVCDLFARARFAPGQSSEQDRRSMVDALRRLHAQDRRSSGREPLADAARPTHEQAV